MAVEQYFALIIKDLQARRNRKLPLSECWHRSRANLLQSLDVDYLNNIVILYDNDIADCR